MERYNYLEEVTNDVINYIVENDITVTSEKPRGAGCRITRNIKGFMITINKIFRKWWRAYLKECARVLAAPNPTQIK